MFPAFPRTFVKVCIVHWIFPLGYMTGHVHSLQVGLEKDRDLPRNFMKVPSSLQDFHEGLHCALTASLRVYDGKGLSPSERCGEGSHLPRTFVKVACPSQDICKVFHSAQVLPLGYMRGRVYSLQKPSPGSL